MLYKIVKDIDVRGLEKQVNLLISDGWKPLGGLCISGVVKLQTIVKEK